MHTGLVVRAVLNTQTMKERSSGCPLMGEAYRPKNKKGRSGFLQHY